MKINRQARDSSDSWRAYRNNSFMSLYAVSQ
jgi:hypothetical protein